MTGESELRGLEVSYRTGWSVSDGVHLYPRGIT